MELAKFDGNCVQKFSSKPEKIKEPWFWFSCEVWLDIYIIISRRRKPGLILVLWISFNREITNKCYNIRQETSNILEDTFSAYNICKGRIFEEINRGTACALGSEKYIKRRTLFCSTRIFCKWVLAAKCSGGGNQSRYNATDTKYMYTFTKHSHAHHLHIIFFWEVLTKKPMEK